MDQYEITSSAKMSRMFCFILYGFLVALVILSVEKTLRIKKTEQSLSEELTRTTDTLMEETKSRKPSEKKSTSKIKSKEASNNNDPGEKRKKFNKNEKVPKKENKKARSKKKKKEKKRKRSVKRRGNENSRTEKRNIKAENKKRKNSRKKRSPIKNKESIVCLSIYSPSVIYFVLFIAILLLCLIYSIL